MIYIAGEAEFRPVEEEMEKSLCEKDCKTRIIAIVVGYIRQNRLSEAWEVLKSIEEKGIRTTRKSYAIFVKELCNVS